MGFNRNSNTATANNTNDESWRAQGFLNISLPTGNGGKRKLGSIGLRDSNPAERELRAWLEKDPGNLAKLVAQLMVEYRSAEPQPGSGFKLD